jgi:hypothetical protein
MKKLYNKLLSIYNLYKDYDYIITDDLNSYHIKSLDRFNRDHGGICWDFVFTLSHELNKNNISHSCYFTSLQKENFMIVNHSYIIVETKHKNFWIECAWQRYKGVREVYSFKDIENLLVDAYKMYDTDKLEVDTVIYDSSKVENMICKDFFEYLNKEGVEV